jgi:hypothetical protein
MDIMMLDKMKCGRMQLYSTMKEKQRANGMEIKKN